MRRIKWMCLLGLLWGAQGVSIAQATDLVVKNAWVRMPPPVSDSAAAYLELHNTSEAAIHLTAVTTDVADMAMMHKSVQQGNIRKMQTSKHVLIPAQSSVIFEPGGSHIMLMGLHKSLHDGDEVYFKLHFSEGSTQSIILEVKDVRNMPQQESTMPESGYEAIHEEMMQAKNIGRE